MNTYGAQETNGLVNGIEYHSKFAGSSKVCWTTDGLTITRLRLLSGPGFPVWDVSYCDGILDGESVRVRLPFNQLPKRSMKKALYSEAKSTGKFIDGLFSSISTLN